MKVGDILDSRELNQLPVGSVVVKDEEGGRGFNTLVRTPSGFTWVDGQGSNSSTSSYGHGGISADGWTLVHLPTAPTLKVGDVIETEKQAAALPVGTVVIDDDQEEDGPEGAPATKVKSGSWLYYDTFSASPSHTINVGVVNHRIVHIPARANAGAVRTAA